MRRFIHEGLSAEALDRLNTEVLPRVQESGAAVPSPTVVNGRFAPRACNVSHRTRRAQVDALLQAIVEQGTYTLRE